jgi:toxin-antitoxin system PIN domain toxin
MSAERFAVDTNVLVYAHFPSSPHHAASYALLQRAERQEITLCVFPQVVAEFISVVTNPRRVSPSKTVEDAVQAVRRVLATPGVVLLSLPESATSTFLDLLLAHPATGPEIVDRQLVAAMMEHGIGTMVTFNVNDFAGIPNVTAKEPAALIP